MFSNETHRFFRFSASEAFHGHRVSYSRLESLNTAHGLLPRFSFFMRFMAVDYRKAWREGKGRKWSEKRAATLATLSMLSRYALAPIIFV